MNDSPSSNQRVSLWRRFWHALGFTYCEGDYYCRLCGKVQR